MKNLSCILAFIALSVAGGASAQDIRATVNGDLVNFPDVQPTLMSGRVMVPVRGVFEHMNASVGWDEGARTVVAQRGTDKIRLPVNSAYATVNGRKIRLDVPATFVRGRTMVPLRFLSESLGATVEWLESSRTVAITTAGAEIVHPDQTGYTIARMDKDTVIPFTLDQQLSSNESKRGDKFKASLDTNGATNYQGMMSGAILEGHVDVARAKTGDTPGVLGLAFDRIRMPNGQAYDVAGSLIGLDADSVINDKGRLVAKPGSKNDNLKYVGYGAGAGALVSILTKGNLLTDAVIGGALGYLFGQTQKSNSQARNVTSEAGTKFGVKLTRQLAFRVPTPVSQ